MLKNNVKTSLKTKFNFNPHHVDNNKIVVGKANNANEVYNEASEAMTTAIDIPNYLVPPAFKKTNTLLICVFQVVNNNLNPFVLFLLHKANEMHLIHMPSFDGGKGNKRLKYESIEYMSKLINVGIDNLSYAGFIETNEHNIIFLEYDNNNTIDTQPILNYYWATVHELVNLKSVLNIPINASIIHFFISNPQLLSLKNDEDVIYSLPLIGYYKAEIIADDEFIDVFKEKVCDNLGFYYSFFAEFPTIIKENEMIMRAALFLHQPLLNDIGDTVVTNDDKHTSLIFNLRNIRYAIKHYSQHIPLSYHTL